MATTSEVKVGLDEIAQIIRGARNVREKISTMATNAVADLNGITTNYADVIATLQAYDATNGTAYEKAAKAEFTALQAEFAALRTELEGVA